MCQINEKSINPSFCCLEKWQFYMQSKSAPPLMFRNGIEYVVPGVQYVCGILMEQIKSQAKHKEKK